MPILTINDDKIKNSRNAQFIRLRDAQWISRNDASEAIKIRNIAWRDLTRNLTINDNKFVESAIYKKFEEDERQLYQRYLKDYPDLADNINIEKTKDIRNQRIEAASKLEDEAVRKFVQEELSISGKTLDDFFRFYDQKISYFVREAICAITEPMGFFTRQEYTLDLTRNRDGDICLRGKMWNIALKNQQSEIINIPGQISWEFVLTPKGFKLHYINCSNQLLEDLCLQPTMDNRDNIKQRIPAAIREEKENKSRGRTTIFRQFFNWLASKLTTNYSLSSMHDEQLDLSIFKDGQKRPPSSSKSQPQQTIPRTKSLADKDVLANWEREQKTESGFLSNWFGSLFRTKPKNTQVVDEDIKRTFKK